MDMRNRVRFHNQQIARGIIGEPAKRAFKRFVGQKCARALAANAQQIGSAAILAALLIAKLGEHPQIEPAQQCSVFWIGESFCIIGHG